MKGQLLILLMVQLYVVPCLAQDFNFHSNSPFGIQVIKEDSTRQAQQIMFVDYDGDEDLDLLIVGLDYLDDADPFTWENIHYFIELQENTGDKSNPHFADRVTVFDNFPFPLGYFFPAAGDLDDDGKVDFIINALVNFYGGRTPIYASNNGSNEFYVTRLDSMDLPDFLPESFFVPELIDLDVDGDLDLLMSGFDPAFGEEDGADIPTYYYAKNTGSKTQPELLGWFSNPYGLTPNPFIEMLVGGDIDNDGDMDLLGTTVTIPSDSMNHFYVHLNNPGADDKPSFGTVLESPFGLPSTFGEDQYLFPELVDIDGDGDLDLFVFLGTADELILQYYENSMISGVENNVLSQAISIYPNPANDVIYIQNDSPFQISKVELISLSGQTMKEVVPNGNAIDVSGLQPGVYFVKLNINGLEIIKRQIII